MTDTTNNWTPAQLELFSQIKQGCAILIVVFLFAGAVTKLAGVW